jgi:hypothetical protein
MVSAARSPRETALEDLPLCFVIGVFVTIAEPDLTLLARPVPAVPDLVHHPHRGGGSGGFLA